MSESFLRLKKIYEKCAEVELRRSTHVNQHPYEIFEDEEELEKDLKPNFIIFQARGMNNESYCRVIENMFSLYGDVKQVIYDSRFENYFFVEFENEEGVLEARDFAKRNRIAIQGTPVKIHLVRSKPAQRS
ncbi:hypothetical protein TVAG_247970 [Trichomonas vaginalis G3]|uniref:RRM domain-containing protein n=1 Tax=Trichomonas vaginalis (strain ATCC PRA-98 / G3) TaxID=412133 RepID=A2FRF2_TRIV3|nr:RNA-binding domain, RBD family-containing protein [Trichomonas vaginalis G3]EAX92516.1 hypothetical protein TVAG_247970 [Trichomonas vaginalis G3]KAI5540783.1 RNA-binding domain, RBD family-containing protein [Trichomonas vaginalis G3]|eukprot:XP_001305446.1 hypothetical protein [Trichomonas vaginalis G3]